MGSSLSHAAWVTIAVVCGLLFLIFDAARTFVHQVSPVTLRRWSGDPDLESRSGWFQYDPLNLRLLSGAMLQMALVAALLATIEAVGSLRVAAVIWLAIVILWKLALGFVPDDLGEAILRRIVPLSHFFYYLFWPVLFPLRSVIERLDREEKEEEEQEEV